VNSLRAAEDGLGGALGADVGGIAGWIPEVALVRWDTVEIKDQRCAVTKMNTRFFQA